MQIELDKFINKKILITGGTGYLGTGLCKKISNIDCEVLVLSRHSNQKKIIGSKANYKYIVGDIVRMDTWKVVLKDVDYVFHLAGMEFDRNNFNHLKNLEVNFTSVVNMLKTCEEFKYKPVIIFSSSSNVAGGVINHTVSEKDLSSPNSVWSLHKLIAEQYLDYYKRNEAIPSVSIRLPNIYGISGNDKLNTNVVLNKVIYNAITSGKINLYGNRKCIRDFLHIDDVIDALLLAALKVQKLNGRSYFYISDGKKRTFEDIWRRVKETAENNFSIKVDIEFNNQILDSLDKRSFCVSPSNFHQQTGWKSIVTLDDGIKRTISKVLKI